MKRFYKGVLRKRKEYVKKKDGGGLMAKSALDDVMREIAIMKTLRHPNVVQLHQIVDDQSEEDKLYLIIDFCEHGQLLNWDFKKLAFSPCYRVFTSLPEVKIANFLVQIVKGVQYLHEQGIVHRDIKPQNILVTSEGVAKIADFGSAVRLPDPSSDTLKGTEGTYHFLAPECCDPDVDSYSGKKADVWAVGVVLYAMVFLRLPFFAETEFGLFNCILKEEIDWEAGKRETTPELRVLLKAILQKDPEKRISLDAILESDFIKIY